MPFLHGHQVHKGSAMRLLLRSASEHLSMTLCLEPRCHGGSPPARRCTHLPRAQGFLTASCAMCCIARKQHSDILQYNPACHNWVMQ